MTMEGNSVPKISFHSSLEEASSVVVVDHAGVADHNKEEERIYNTHLKSHWRIYIGEKQQNYHSRSRFCVLNVEEREQRTHKQSRGVMGARGRELKSH